MEALAISAANLDVIEKNLGSVAKELSGVINNVNSVSDQVNGIEDKVANLNNDFKNLVNEIRENTVIVNARQTIMFNNAEIEKKFGYYDNIRRTTLSFLDAFQNSKISKKSVFELRETILLNNPDYWLVNALAAVFSWLLNDRSNTETEVKNAIRKNAEKSYLFFMLINLKVNRKQAAINWLRKYLTTQNPLSLNKEFITILDLVTQGLFGVEEREIVFKKINIWVNETEKEKKLKDLQIDKWKNYIKKYYNKDIDFEESSKYITNYNKIEENIRIVNTYQTIENSINDIINQEIKPSDIDMIMRDLIYKYEEKEQIYQKDNERNKLIIDNNGDLKKAQSIIKEKEEIFENKTNILSLLSNIVIHNELYNVSNSTLKYALKCIGPYILEAYEEINNKIYSGPYYIKINDFETETTEGNNYEKIKYDIYFHTENMFKDNNTMILIISLLLISIFGIIALFITRNIKALTILTLIIIILGSLIIGFKIIKLNILRKEQKERISKDLTNKTDIILAEIIEYKNYLNNQKKSYNQIESVLNAIQKVNMTTSEERDIEIGD